MPVSGPQAGPLNGRWVAGAGGDAATDHAIALLVGLGATRGTGDLEVPTTSVDPPVDWAQSGAMALTGRAAGPPLHPVGAPASAARGAIRALATLVADHGSPPAAWPDHRLLGERAAIAGLRRQGPKSAGGALRIIACADGWVACNLPRRSDVELLPALTQGRHPVAAEPDWPLLERWFSKHSRQEVTAQAVLLGLPITDLPGRTHQADQQHRNRWGHERPAPWRVSVGGPRHPPRTGKPLVVDLTSLWAGPLAAHLLGLVGARVVKVESTGRPDGARCGHRAFFDLLHAGHECVALKFPDPAAVSLLRQLCVRADLVLDASRPRALAALGIDAEEMVAGGTSWVSITGYGRTGPWANRPAFGDDAAAAAGLVAWDHGEPLPAGDAIADPLTGVHAAVAGYAALLHEQSWLIDVAMRDVAACAAAMPAGLSDADHLPEPPRARPPAGKGHFLGADTGAVLADLGIVP